jgi:Arc/MetJ-type ribon-helix-helix transcriptional regulator
MPRLPKLRKKKHVTVRLGLQQWAKEQVKKGSFQNFSHVVEEALERLRGLEKG